MIVNTGPICYRHPAFKDNFFLIKLKWLTQIIYILPENNNTFFDISKEYLKQIPLFGTLNGLLSKD